MKAKIIAFDRHGISIAPPATFDVSDPITSEQAGAMAEEIVTLSVHPDFAYARINTTKGATSPAIFERDAKK